MNWKNVREHYPESWVVIEALKAHEKNDQKIIDDIAVIDQYSDVMEAMKQYNFLHKSEPQRDVLVVNTINEELDIKVTHWSGIRRYS